MPSPTLRVTSSDRRVARHLFNSVTAQVNQSPGGMARRSIEHLVDSCAPLAGRPIRLLALTADRWLKDDDPDSLITGVALTRRSGSSHIILVRDDVHGRHRDHIIAHELAHLLFEHHWLDRSTAADDLQGEIAKFRTSLSSRHEREAEAFADLVCTRLLSTTASVWRGRYNWEPVAARDGRTEGE